MVGEAAEPAARARPSQQSRFGQMSEAIIGRIDEMGNRIDDLEKSIGELMQQAGVEDQSDMQGNAPGQAQISS